MVKRHVHFEGILSLVTAECDLPNRLPSILSAVLFSQHALALYEYRIQTPITVPTGEAPVFGHKIVAIAVVYILVSNNFICAIISKPISHSISWIQGFGMNPVMITVFKRTTSFVMSE